MTDERYRELRAFYLADHPNGLTDDERAMIREFVLYGEELAARIEPPMTVPCEPCGRLARRWFGVVTCFGCGCEASRCPCPPKVFIAPAPVKAGFHSDATVEAQR